jgi:hypothetical protein
MSYIKSIILLLIGSSLTFMSCIKDTNPPLPAYIQVNTVAFQSDSAQGSSSSNIQDAWVSVDGQLLGTNTLPVISFPVIVDENFQTNTIRIAAGIADNGISNTRRIYPFYLPFDTTMKLTPGETYTFSPTLRYDSTATVRIIEDFEPTGTIFSEDLDNNPNTFMERQNTDVFEGNFSGRFVLDSANLECTVATAVRYSNLQPNATSFPVYLEMDYNTNASFSVGIIAHYGSQTQINYIAGVNSTGGDWNKIYFNLTEAIFAAGASQYSIIFRITKPIAVDQVEAYIDNIKLVHY